MLHLNYDYEHKSCDMSVEILWKFENPPNFDPYKPLK